MRNLSEAPHHVLGEPFALSHHMLRNAEGWHKAHTLRGWHQVEPGADSLSWSYLTTPEKAPDGADICYVPSLFSFSDYTGSDVELANQRAFAEMLAGEGLFGVKAFWVYGGYGSKAIALFDGEYPEEIVEALEDLGDYPLLDEALLGEVHLELYEEAWESYLESDTLTHLVNLLAAAAPGDSHATEALGGIWPDSLAGEVFYGPYGAEIETGGGVYVDLGTVFPEGATLEDFQEYSTRFGLRFAWEAPDGTHRSIEPETGRGEQ